MSSIAAIGAPAIPTPAKPVAVEVEKSPTEVRQPAGPGGHLSLAQTLDMADNLAELRSSLTRRRAGGREGGDDAVSGTAWADQVLDEEVWPKVASIRQTLETQQNLSSLRSFIAGLFPDPSDQVLVLRSLLDDEEIDRINRSQLQELLDEVLASTDPKTLKAGINVAVKAKLFGSLCGTTPKALRESYRDFLGSAMDTQDQYEFWISQYGFDKRFLIVDFIEKSLAVDMYSLDPSCSRLEFGNLLTYMRGLSTIRSADRTFLAECWNEDLMGRLDVTREQLLREMLSVVRNAGGFRKLFDGAFVKARFTLSTGEKALLVQRLRRALKAIPHDLWFDASYQVRAIDELDELTVRANARESALSPSGQKVIA
jgi:type III secretion system protein